MKLTPKQKKFADEYIKSGNATKAAIDAGYSRKTAAVIGTENLIKPNIKKYIAERMSEIESNRIMSAQEALEGITRIARGEELETVVVATPMGAETVDKPPDLKTRMTAYKEILKRYPDNDRMLNAQIRKMEAEANISETRLEQITSKQDDIESGLTTVMDLLMKGDENDGDT